MAPRYGTIDFEYAGHLANCPPAEDGPVLMVNYMKYRERASYRDGSDGGRSGKEADDEYAPTEVLADIGAVVAFFGDVVDDAASTGWDRIGIVQYATRRSFIEMQSRQDFREKHRHKEAGMDHTIVFGVPPHLVTGSAPGRTSRVVFDLVRADTPTASPATGQVAGPVEGTIMGDGRVWTELRVTWLGADDPLPALDDVADRERVVVTPSIDRLATLVATAQQGV
ncbi:MAG: hypothetical protein R2713_11035 [Ilumatobacteraceae bacterium]|nr:hypothetical protein [Acidimicrobiales bacterium]MCB9392823.1 hypothetical protein [Acidimicrobiaceae bacterium]